MPMNTQPPWQDDKNVIILSPDVFFDARLCQISCQISKTGREPCRGARGVPYTVPMAAGTPNPPELPSPSAVSI